MSRWKVQKIGDMWEATDPAGEYTQAFLWWDMAVAYADSLARTIEVERVKLFVCGARFIGICRSGRGRPRPFG